MTTTPETPEQRWAKAIMGPKSTFDEYDEALTKLAAVKRLADRAEELEREVEEMRATKGPR